MIKSSPSANTIAVVTTFNPGQSLVDLCVALHDQVQKVIVVDDRSEKKASSILDICRKNEIQVITLESNSGIATALNSGIIAAMTATPKPDYILTVDQDSYLASDYVPRLIQAAEQANAMGISTGMVAPERVEGLPPQKLTHRNGVLLGAEPIQSGLLIPTEVLNKIGPFRESLFIDCVDTEFYMRARSHGLNTVVAEGTSIKHSLGDKYYLQVFGKRLTVQGRSFGIVRSAPFRYYYMARNRVIMNRLFGKDHPGWAIHETFLDLRHFIIVLLLIPGRWRNIRLLFAGWLDGIRGIGGKISPHLQEIAHGL